MKPMLAASIKDVKLLRFPLIASPKIDGVRATIIRGCVMSRSMKPIPNMEVQDKFGHLEGIDGELVAGPPTDKDVYRRTVSTVMTIRGNGSEVQFLAFDNVVAPNAPYLERLTSVPASHRAAHFVCSAVNEVTVVEEKLLTAGYEGVILRCPNAAYKAGRSTLREQGMLKLKRFVDDEAKVVGMDEQMHNANPEFRNELGHAAHTSHQANMVPMNTLGALVCQWRGMIFRVGTGFTDAERDEIWADKSKYIGWTAKFKYLQIGIKNLPRHPVFLGWRM